jgi:EpsI family protein
VFFGIVIAIMFWIGSLWREDLVAKDASAPVVGPSAEEPPTPRPTQRFAVAAVAATVAAGLWLPIGYWIDASANPAPPGPLAVAPENGWHAVENEVPAWKPHFSGQRAEYERMFTKDGQRVGLYIAYYSNQIQDRELVNSENVLVPSNDPVWKQVASGAGSLRWAGDPIDVMRAELRSTHERLAVARWYWIGGRYTASDMRAKLMLAFEKLTGEDDDSAALVIYAPYDDSRTADETLGRFAAEMSGAVVRALEQASRR